LDALKFIQRSHLRADLRLPIYRRILRAYFANSASLDCALLIAEHLRDLETLRNSIRSRSLGYFRRDGMLFLTKLTKGRRNVVPRLVRAIASVVTDVAVPRTALFEICTTALDAVPLRPLPTWAQVQAQFRAVLFAWGRTIWPAYQSAPAITRRMNLVLRAAKQLGQVRGAATGQVLTIILNFSCDLSVIVEDPGLWGIIFYFALWIAQADEVLPLFLFFHHCIFPEEGIAGRWGARLRAAWEEFARGMWQIVQNDPELNAVCADRERAVPELFPGT
jgi:hypothetical protein